MKKIQIDDKEKGVHEPCTTNNDERKLLPDDFANLSKHGQKLAIVEAVKNHFPDDIDEKVFHFPFNFFYFITDKGKFFAIEKKLKAPLNSDVAIRFEKKFCELTVCEAMGNEVHEELKQELSDLAHEKDNELFFEYSISPRKLNKQLDIYLNKQTSMTVSKLGYTIHERETERTVTRWNDETLNFEQVQQQQTHYFVKLTDRVFLNACYSNRLLIKGLTRTIDGTVEEVKKGRTKGCNNSHLSKKIEFVNVETKERFVFDTMTDAAKEFKVAKSNFSRKMKDKQNGDILKFGKVKFQFFWA